MLLPLVFLAPSANAAYTQTGSWTALAANGIAVGNDGSVYTARFASGINPAWIEKWTATGATGTPATFGGPAFFYGVAVNSLTGNLYTYDTTSGKISTFQPDGTPVGTPFAVDASNGARLGTDGAGNVYFPNQTDKTVEKYSPAGVLLDTLGPNPGGTPFNGPLDVAADSAGNVYAADFSTSANEVQSVLRGVTGNVATGGTYELSFDGQTTGANGTGDISAAGGSGDVNRATGTGDRSALATGTGNRTSGSNLITNLVTTTGAFAVGEAISGSGIPTGATIAAVDATTLTLSAPVSSTGTAGALTSGSKTLTNVATSTGAFAVGMTITGTGIPAGGTTITAVGANTLTLSAGVTSAGTAGALTAGNVTNASATTGAFAVGMTISGTGIPGSTTITAVNGGTLTLSNAPSAAGTAVALSAGSTTLTNVNTSSGAFATGLTIAGAGIPVNATITAVGPNTLTLSAAPTASGTGVPLTADLGFNAATGAVDAALESLPAIGAGNVSVSGSGAAARDVTFNGALAATNVSEMTCNGANLTYAGAPPSPLCAVTTTTQGSYSAGRVVKFDSNGDFVSNFVTAPKYTAIAIDVDRTTNNIFVLGGPTNGSADLDVNKYNLAGAEVDSFGLGVIGSGTNQIALAVNPTTGNVYTTGFTGTARIWSPAFGLTVTKAGTGTGKVTSAPAGIDCGSDCSEDYASGTLVTLSQAADAGSTFTGWSGACTGTGTCQVTMSAAKAVTATFDKTPRNLTINKAGTGNGSFTCDTGSGPGACAASYPNGTTITIAATPSAGSSFAGWSGGGCTGTGNCVINAIAADTTLTATFNLIPRALTINKAGTGNGSLTCNGTTCASSYPNGTTITVVATPNGASSFAGWSGGGCTGTGNCVINAIAADTTLTATFNAIPTFALNISKAGSGSGTVTSSPAGISCGSDCSEQFAQNAVITLSQVASPGSEFTGWSGACTGTGTCQVTMSAAKAVTATFATIPTPPDNGGGDSNPPASNPPATTPPASTPPATTPPAKKPLKCKKGFKKKKVRGKQRCVKLKPKKRGNKAGGR